jgi:GxxExxY protein
MKNMKGVKEVEESPLVREVIGCAIEVHRTLGPGLLESAYEQCLAHELSQRKISFAMQKQLAVEYKGIHIDCGYRIDMVIQDELLLELKSVEHLLPIHEAQILTYLKLAGLRHGLLINFNVRLLCDGIRSFLLD